MEQVEVTFVVTRNDRGEHIFRSKDTGWRVSGGIEGYLRSAFDDAHGVHEGLDLPGIEHDNPHPCHNDFLGQSNERG